ncbi:hypothetical protein [Sphingomonas lenta]|uniref:hypothetical protein n=1 Tax=Sphingomonas lenta TaxID=1141887 RepID=UPI001C3EB061|nr:hypothetical protein [Sphingomonas lenta]
MFNLIMRWFDWADGVGSMPVGRMFEYTEDHVAEQFRQERLPLVDRLSRLPCLFMGEGTGDEVCHIGTITRARVANGEVHFDFVLDREVPPLTNATIFAGRRQLDMPHDFEFSRNHWAVKDVDLYRFLMRNVRPGRQRPSVFQLPDHENIEPQLASAMMPFDAAFTPVYESIRQATEAAGLRCRRADDIWENRPSSRTWYR